MQAGFEFGTSLKRHRKPIHPQQFANAEKEKSDNEACIGVCVVIKQRRRVQFAPATCQDRETLSLAFA
jgi:hypothetical protein